MDITLLDCTLRDGGYINNWLFSNKNINMIYENLSLAKVDYIELGYIDKNASNNINSTKFNSFDSIKQMKINKKSVCMIDYGKFPIEEVPNKKDTNLWGIRLAFSKNNLIEALNYCNLLKKKGYKVFIQPMVTKLYSTKELEFLFNEANKINPYAIYIVDSFGSMDEKTVIKLLKQYDKYLNKSIKIGFHSHNNLSLSYSNSVAFIKNRNNRKIIIDSSVYGIGRGAGNLPTELITSYLNQAYSNEVYKSYYLLEIVNNYLSDLKKKNNWGYCLEYYLSAINDCHPNYSKYLSEMHTLTINDMQKILKKISDNKRSKFDKEYIMELYESYMNNDIDDTKSYQQLKHILSNKKLILLGSGPSINKYKDKIISEIDNKSVVISVNSINKLFNTDYVFISNRRRFADIKEKATIKIISTSNIECKFSHLIFNYIDNLATEYENSDNSLLILLNILMKTNVEKVYLAGFDGLDFNVEKNYYNQELEYVIEREKIKKTNKLMKKYLNLYSKKIEINWLTKSNYQKEELK